MIGTGTVLDSWRTVRQNTGQAVREFPAAELDFKPVGEVMTFREIARHILEAGHALTGLLLGGVENMATPQFRDMLQKYIAELPSTPDAPALAQTLRQGSERRTAQLGPQPAEFFAHVITRFDGQQVTRLEMMPFAKEHELTCRAQWFLYSRLKSVVPVTTRCRLAKQPKA